MRVLVTGAARAIGRATVEVLAARGHEVVATARNPALLEGLPAVQFLDARRERRRFGARPPSRRRASSMPSSTTPACPGSGPLETYPLDVLRAACSRSTPSARCAWPRRSCPAWRERGSGVLVNISSVQGRIGTPLEGAYAASKHALEALSETLYFELGHFGIRVVIVEPGYIAPGMKHDDDHAGPGALRRPRTRNGARTAEHADRARRSARSRAGGRSRWPTRSRTRRRPLRVEVGDGCRHGAAAAPHARRCRVRGHHARGARADLVTERRDSDGEADVPGRGSSRTSTRAEVAERLLGPVARGAARPGAAAPDHRRLGSRERHPRPRAHPRGRDAPARAGLAVGRLHRAPGALRGGARGRRRSGWPATRWSSRSTATTAETSGRSPRSWPDGERSPGRADGGAPSAASRLRPSTSGSPGGTPGSRRSPSRSSLACRYVRNAVFRPDHRRGAPGGGDRGGGVALAGARDRPDALLLCGRRPRDA